MEDPTVSSDEQRIILSHESSVENDGNVEHQYAVLSLGQGLQEDQQLAIELAGENGVKYLYILNDGIPEQKITIDTGNHGNREVVTEIDVSNETHNSDKTLVSAEIDNEKKRRLKLIEERSCGTMTEDHLMASGVKVESGQSSVETNFGKNSKGAVTHPTILVKHRPKKKLIRNENIQKTETDTSKKLICFDEFANETKELCKSDTLKVSNEMKITQENKDKNVIENHNGEKDNSFMEAERESMKEDFENDQPLDKKDSSCVFETEIGNDDMQEVNEQTISLDNDQADNSLQLESIDDATCKEILESISISGAENNDEKNDKAETEQNKRRYIYERPTTRNMTKIKINENSKKGKKKFKCEICSKEYFQKQSLEDHFKTHDNISYSCKKCPKKFDTQKKLKCHIKRHSTAQPHLCDVCGKAFRIKETLENHMYIHSETAEKPFKCTVCGIAFLKKYYLIRHESCHTGEKPFSCKECQKSFRTKGDLHRHMRLHGEKLGVEPFKCKTCGKCYCSESGLLRHERAHSGEKPYSCTHCSKSFSMPGDLRVHVKTHFGGDYLPCQLCGKVLTSAVGFKRHQRMHTGEKPYKCTECSNKFVDQWGLMKHQRLHQLAKEDMKRRQKIKVLELIEVEPLHPTTETEENI